MEIDTAILTFQIEDQLYGLAVGPIEGIVPMVTISPIQEVSSVAEGVINVRGAAVPVIDLPYHLGKQKSRRHFHTPIILLKANDLSIGLVVENVSDVISLPASKIVHPSEFLSDEMSDGSILAGVAFTTDEVLLVLDPDRLFKPGQVEMLEKITAHLDEFVQSGGVEALGQEGAVELAA